MEVGVNYHFNKGLFIAKAQLNLYLNTLLTSGYYLTAKDLLNLFSCAGNMKYVTAFPCEEI